MTAIDTETLADVIRIFNGSDGDATKALFARLEPLGDAGAVAINLYRAHKSSGRAKVYRGRGYRGMAYDRKGWALSNLSTILTTHAEALGLRWGWGIDDKQAVHRYVLYVDLPNGQVSFHAGERGAGPDYPNEWDRIPNASAGRVITWIAQLLSPAARGGASGASTPETARGDLA